MSLKWGVVGSVGKENEPVSDGMNVAQPVPSIAASKVALMARIERIPELLLDLPD